jgi:putative endonuclease
MFYTGFTDDLRRRVAEHNNRTEFSTKSRAPFELVYYEACLNKYDALRREKYLKSGMGKKFIRNRIKSHLGENETCV